MSIFSGKCDVFDSLIMINKYTEEELKNSIKIYVGDSTTPLHIEKKEDLIPYYPHIIGCVSYNNAYETTTIHITSESYVDIEERRILEIYIRYFVKLYNKCKRKKIEFDINEAVEQICWSNYDKEQITELAKRVKEKGKKADINGIHLKLKDYYRQELVNEMINNGLNPADYGYERFIKER